MVSATAMERTTLIIADNERHGVNSGRKYQAQKEFELQMIWHEIKLITTSMVRKLLRLRFFKLSHGASEMIQSITTQAVNW